jgi:hypothetical protein
LKDTIPEGIRVMFNTWGVGMPALCTPIALYEMIVIIFRMNLTVVEQKQMQQTVIHKIVHISKLHIYSACLLHIENWVVCCFVFVH